MRSLPLLLVIGLTAAPLALLPAAVAHTCTAVDPATQCGPCGGSVAHDHNYWDGRNYCTSTGGGPTYVCVDVNGQKEVCVTITSLAQRALGADDGPVALHAEGPARGPASLP